MKIYFNASLAGKEKNLSSFKKIISIIENLGYQVVSDHVIKRDYRKVNKQMRDEHEADFQKARQEIHKADAMVVEATYPSIGVGHTMTLALQLYKPILVLTQNTPHGLLIGDPNRLLTIKQYNPTNTNQLQKTIKEFLNNIEKRLLRIRFNLMIDKDQEKYLNEASKRLNISKSDVVRQLIDKAARQA